MVKIGQLEQKNAGLKQEVADIWSVVGNQVRSLEKLDSRERMNKLVVLGSPEAEWNNCSMDEEKVDVIGSAAECVVSRSDVTHSGRKREGVDRPLLVTLAEAGKRNSVVEKLKTVFQKPGFSNIRVRNDVHPAVRTEWARLHAKHEELKRDPGNASRGAELERVKRTITRDGVIVDGWKPRFSEF